MVIIWGSRPYFRSNVVVQHGFCEHCDQFAKLKSFDARRFFHLYYIPLIPTQGKRRNHKMCPKCKVSQVIEPEAFETIIRTFKQHSADALVAVLSGDETFRMSAVEPDPGAVESVDESGGGVPEPEDDDEPSDAVSYLHVVQDWIYAAGDAQFCEGIVQKLADPAVRYAREVLAGNLAIMRGNVDAAVEHYAAAADAKPDEAFPVLRRTHLLELKGRPEEVVEGYGRVIELVEDPRERLGPLIRMADQQMTLKRFGDAVTSYERVFEIEPSLASEKPIAKAYKKAKKKAGV